MSSPTPPFSLEAEQSVLGAMLIDSDAIVQVADLLRPDDFYRKAHQVIYAVLLDLYEHQTPADIVTVAERIERNGDLDVIGGRVYLASLSNETPSATHVETYGRVVYRKAVMRRLVTAAAQISAIAHSDPVDFEAAVDAATEEIYRVADTRAHKKYQYLRDLLHAAYDKVELLSTTKGEVTGIGTGLNTLDRLTQGFQSSDLVIVAARPGVGKSSFALGIAEHVAVRDKKTVGLFSLEMSSEQLIVRLLSSVSGVDSQRLRSGFLRDDDWERLTDAMSTLSDAAIYIDDTSTLTVTELRTRARRMKAEVGLDVLIVDYLQLMHSPGSGGRDNNRVQEVSAITRGLKQLARELNVPVIALSQLSRNVEGRDSAEPRLSDLRDSGSVEQDSDLVLFLWKKRAEHDDNDQTADGEWVNLKLAKHRNGPTGELQLWFRKSQTRFYERERDYS